MSLAAGLCSETGSALPARVAEMKEAGLRFRNEIETGPAEGGLSSTIPTVIPCSCLSPRDRHAVSHLLRQVLTRPSINRPRANSRAEMTRRYVGSAMRLSARSPAKVPMTAPAVAANRTGHSSTILSPCVTR